MLPTMEKSELHRVVTEQPIRPQRRTMPIGKNSTCWPIWLCFLLALSFVICYNIALSHATNNLIPPWFGIPELLCPSLECRLHRILMRSPLIDGHNDFLIMTRTNYSNHIYTDDFKSKFERGGMVAHVDIPRLEEGMVNGTFWSAFVGCPANGSDFSDENYASIVRATLEQLDLYHRLGAAYPRYFTPTPNAAAAYKLGRNQLIAPAIIEGLHQIGNSVDTLRLYHRLGVRYATLTWNCHNIYADAACVINEAGRTVKSTPLHGGLSDQGRDIVREMNRLGMMVDLSHVSVDTMREVLNGTKDGNWTGSLAPPIFSHSSAYSICPHPRNVPDDILQHVKQRNSIVMVNFNPDFISCVPGNDSSGMPIFDEANSSIKQVARHIMHIGNTIGYDHVGLGSDFDGIEKVPIGLEDVSYFPDVVKTLLRLGVDDQDVEKVMGKNILRVWQEVDKVAEQLQMDGTLPLEGKVKLPW